ncbi:MAG: exo-alpha-sialidase, partial [Spirochaetes bacterium]|nr:exo-alpha-sialidase [Spirochaetota bacterium]
MREIILKNVAGRSNSLSKNIIIFLLFFIFSPLVLWSYPQGWSKDYKVYDEANSPQLFMTEQVMGIAFLVKKSNDTSIYMSLSDDKGKNWGKPQRLVKKIGKKFEYFSSRVDDNMLYIGWGEDDGFIYLLRYSFTNQQIISKDRLPHVETFACLPRIFVDKQTNIHVFYHKEDNEVFTLYHIVSFDKGRKWSQSHKIVGDISPQTKGIFFPSAIFWGDYILVVWQSRQGGKGDEKIDDEIYFSFSKDLGQSWVFPHRISNNRHNDSRPFLVLDDNEATIYLLWENKKQGDWDISMLEGKIIDEDTVEWEPENLARVISDTSSDAYDAQAVLKGKDLYIFWYDFRQGKSQLFYRIFNLENRELSAEIQLTDTKLHSKKQDVISYSNTLSLVWEVRVEDYSRIFFKQEDRDIDTPVISSPTHPSNRWVNNKKARIKARELKDESGIKGFSYIMDRNEDTEPDIINYNFSEFHIDFADLEDGTHWFHLRAVDNNNNWSDTAHYRINIDTKGPVIVDTKVIPRLKEA